MPRLIPGRIDMGHRMARTSDTRRLTREAAAQLVADGRLPHTVTVDQIYGVIGQGSRTTINDALKRWKVERAQADALAETLPPAIADAMRALWAAAVEQGGQHFAAERNALIQERDAARDTAQAQSEAQQRADARIASLTDQVTTLTATLELTEQELARVDAARAAAVAEATALREAFEQLRQESARERADARAAQEGVIVGHQMALAEHDATFRQELDRANEWLQQTEARMLKQVDDARIAARRSDAQLATVREQSATLRAELAELRQRAARDLQDLTAARGALAAAQTRQADADRHDAERERALITATAQVDAAQRVIGSLEAALQRGRRGRTPPPA